MRVWAAALLLLAACPSFEGPCARDLDCLGGERCVAGACAACEGSACATPSPSPTPSPTPTAPPVCGFFETFADLDARRFEVVGAALPDFSGDARIRLSEAGHYYAAGGVFARERFDATSFVLEAVFEIGASGSADGFALGWFDAPLGSIGVEGAGLGYMGMRGYAIEVDLFANPWDAGIGTHLALVETSSAIPGRLGTGASARYFRRHAVAPLEGGLAPGTHTLELRFDRGAAEVWLDGERRLSGTIPNYRPFAARFGATAANGGRAADQSVLELGLHCGLPSDGEAHPFYPARRRVLVRSSTGATTRLPLPFEARPGSRRDGRDVALYAGQAPVRFQWEDLAATHTPTAAIVFEVPRGDAPTYLYYGGGGSSRATDGVFTFTERFGDDAGRWLHSWNRSPTRCPDRVSTTGVSACALGSEAPFNYQQTAAVLSPDLGLSGKRYVLDFFVAGGFRSPRDLLFVATASGAPVLPSVLRAEAFDPPWVPTATGTVNGRFVSYPIVGFPLELGGPWRHVRARFEPLRRDDNLVFVLVVGARIATDADVAVLLDDVTVRVAEREEREAELGPVEP